LNDFTIGIPIAFTLVTALLLWFVIGSKGNWFVKFLSIVATLFFGFAVWNSIDQLVGWPTNVPLPKKYVYHWGVVKEDKEIIVLVEEINPKASDGFDLLPEDITKQPRLHRLDYSKEDHKKIEQANKMVKSGRKVIGEEGEGEGGKQGGGMNGPKCLMLRELPPPKPFPKHQGQNSSVQDLTPIMPTLPKFD
jgi:hypothetical protein